MAEKDVEKKASFKNALRTFVFPRKKILSIGLILILISRAAGFILPLQMTTLFDDIIPTGDYASLTVFLIVVISALFIQSAMSFVLTLILSVESHRLIADLRVKVQKKVLSLPISYFDNNKSGAVVSRIMTDVEGVRNLIGTGLVQLVGGAITSIGSIYFLAKINWRMTLFVLVPMVILGVLMLKAFGKIRPIFRDRGKINAEVTGRLTETLNGVRVIKGFNAAKQENSIFRKGAFRLFDNVRKSLTATALIQSSTIFLIGTTTACIMALGAHHIISNEVVMTIGQLITFNLLIIFMVAPISQMSNIGSQFTEALAGLDRTEELLNMDAENDPKVRTNILTEVTGDVEFENVSFSYEEDKEVVHNISFNAPLGSVTALVGSSGSGKSTIAGLASSFMAPDSGRVLVDGHDLSKVDLGSYRSHLGVVLQDDFLFEGTIRENILFPRPDATEEQLLEAVKTAYIDEFTDDFEKGLDTVIGERGVKLSGGQRQRIAIARAVLADPKIIILDEATSNLDNESEAFIQKSLATLMNGRTTFVIAHRLTTIRKADQILVIEKGVIAEQGTHDSLIEKEGRYYELFTYQSRI
ncbi:MAG: ATP-binding cassette domain-containing protein [Crocinitomix sp.]|nr:ATP-binding cassette domain-containing protein [Crocinitomix sp.]